MSYPMPHRPHPVRPASLTAAFWLLVASAAVVVAGAARSIAGLYTPQGEASLRDAIAATPGALDGELDVDTLIGISQTTAVAMQVFVAVVSIAVVLALAFWLRAGRRYVRAAATVLAALQGLLLLGDPNAVSVLSFVLVVAAVALSWTGSSGRYVAERAMARRDVRAPERVLVR